MGLTKNRKTVKAIRLPEINGYRICKDKIANRIFERKKTKILEKQVFQARIPANVRGHLQIHKYCNT